MFCLAWQYLVWPGTVIQSVVDRKFFLSCWLLKTHWVCTSQLTSVLFIYLKLEFYLFGKEFVTIFIALSFLSKLSGNSSFLHRRGSRAQEKHFSNQKYQKSFVCLRKMCLMVWKRTFYGNVDLSTTCQCRQLRLNPLSTQINIYCLMTNQTPALLVQRAPWTLLRASLTWLRRKRSVSIRKKYPLEPRV